MKKLLLPLSVVVLSLSLGAADRLDCTDEIAKTPAKAFEYVVTCDRPDGIYRCGEEATMTVRVRNATTGAPVSVGTVRVEIDGFDGRVSRTEEHDLAKKGPVFTVKGTRTDPGFLRLRLHKGDESKFKIWSVAFDPDRIPAGVDDPPDFDAFWSAAYAKYVKDVPFDFEMRFDADKTSPWNDVYRFSFAAPDGKTRLYGFVSYPKDRTRKYPARFEVPSAGIGGWTLGPSPYQRDRTVNVLLNIFPFEMPKTVKEANVPYQAYCKALEEKYHCKHYMSAGMGASREESTLYNYFLGAKRCIEWLWEQPEVDQSNFCYWGASQGGGYGTCVVGLSGRFTKAVVCVPCLVHDLGRFGREASGSGSNVQAMHTVPAERAVAVANWPYFSAENFARRIRCETMVTVGFCDPTCAPHGGWSIYNLMPAAKKSIVGAVNQPHGPPDPVWYGTQEWLFGFPGWRETFGPQLGYVHGAAARAAADSSALRRFTYERDNVIIRHPLVTEPVRFSLVADSHFAMLDGRDEAYRANAARMMQWPGKEAELDGAFARAKKHGSKLMVMAGDMFSFPSLANVEFLQRKIASSGLDCRYIAGNHDWRFEGLPGGASDLRREWIEKRMKPLYRGEDPMAYAFVHQGIRFVLLDDSTAGVSAEQLAFVRAELARGEPTVLVLHVPFQTSERSYSDALAHPRKDGTVEPRAVELRELAFSSANVLAVFAGHDHDLQVSCERGVPQVVLPEAYNTGRSVNVVLLPASTAAVRPYEFGWANRTADEFPPSAALEDASGWTAKGSDAELSLESATEFALFGKGTARVRYRVTGGKPSFVFAPEKPIACPDGFDTLSVWVRATNVRRPHLDFQADFRDADGKPFSLELGKIRHDEWHCEIGVVPPGLRARTAKGASFVGFTVSGGTNGYARTFDFTSLCLFRDPQRPLPKTERAKRGVQLFKDQPQGHNTGAGRLPFPNRADTMMPPRKEIAGLEFRLPEENATAWDALAFRLDGGAWIPLAVGGGIFPRAAAKDAKVHFHREDNSVVADIEAAAGVEEVLFGAGLFPSDAALVAWPYLTLNWCDRYDVPGYEKGGIYQPKTAVFKVGDRIVCAGAMFDWTQSNASAPTDRDDAIEGEAQLCCGLMYVPKTDGTRNRVFERYVWTVGEEPADVFPVVPNPDSPWKHVTGTGVWRAHPASDDRRDDYRFWQSVRDAGMKHIIVTDHEKMWRDGNESFTFRTKTAPRKGGDKGAADYARFMIDRIGFRYGPYNNFTDFAAVNGHWAMDRVGRRWDGSLITAWNRCYSPKSTWAVGMCEKLAPELKRKFGFNTAYCDVHTCVSPWNRCDYDVRTPGAGTFAQVFYDYGEIMLMQKAAWEGPVYSEGGFHWWYCGLTDGSYAQDYTYNLSDGPWLVDFDLVRLHDKGCNFGMGAPDMFYRMAKDGPSPRTDREEYLMRFLAATIAFGHPGFLVCNPKATDLDEAKTSYFLVQGIAAKYTQASVRDVRYADATGRLFAPAEALLNGAAKRSQVFVRYSDGTEVAVNGSRTETYSAVVHGNAYELPPNGWAAVSGDRTAGSLNVMMNSERFQCGWSDEYEFWRRNGKISQLKTDRDRLQALASDPQRARKLGETTAFRLSATTNVTVKVWADNCGQKTVLPERTIELAAGRPVVLEAAIDEPGFLRLHVKATEGRISTTETVAYAPEKIEPVLKRPDDFDAYWDGELARLEREVPLDPKMDLLQERSTGDLNEYALSFATFNDKRVYGFVTVPKAASAANRMGLRVTVPGAGPAACRTWDAAPDVIVATLNALPYKPGKDEKEQGQIYADYNKMLKEKYGVDIYPGLGWGIGREEVFFHDAIVGIVRAVRWLAKLPEVDPARLTYFGGSQGGGLGMATVALAGGFSRACFYITAMSDLYGSDAGRVDGWPSRASRWPYKQPEDGKKVARRVAPYYDACNFASRITCPVRVSLGLEDTTCNPPNVQASYNRLGSAEKRMTFDPDTAHGIRGETLTAVYEWLKK